jgi:hypothetical protein
MTPVQRGEAARAADAAARSRTAAPARQDHDPVVSATVAAQIPRTVGNGILRNNPQLEIQWRSTVSPVTGKSGFSRPLERMLDANGIRRDFPVNGRPAGGTTNNTPAARTQNGNAARDAIADRFRADPRYSDVRTEQTRQTALGGRRVDVTTVERGPRPGMNRNIEVESKLGRASASSETRLQVAKDAERLANNASVRRVGTVLTGVGRVARPVGMVIDAVQVGSAYRADGNRIGANTQRAVGSLAGGAAGAWGGAQAGAAIGSLGGPVGTVVGGVVGAAVGGIVGSGVGAKAVDWVRSWF